MEALAELHSFTFGGQTAGKTKESILAEELAKLKNYKLKLKEQNTNYISDHPELKSILDEFVTAILSDKPTDIIRFGAHFFTQMKAARIKEEDLHLIKPLVFAGPSGVGKGTIVGILMKRYPKIFGFSVSHTTRQPRPGEENGVHYHFVEKPLMEEGIAKGEFIEHANVHTNIYGTSFKAVETVQSQGKICILDIDIQGVQKVKRSVLRCNYLFISPPSMEVLESRLRGRGTESEDKIQIRMKNAEDEMAYGTGEGNFDGIVVNTDIEVAVSEILEKLSGWYPNIEFTS